MPLIGASTPGRRARRVRGALTVFAAWTIFGVLHAIYWLATGFWQSQTPMPISYSLGAIGTALLLAWTWAALTPLIFGFAERVLPSRVGWARSLASHAVVVAAIAALMTALRIGLLIVLAGDRYMPGAFVSRLAFLADVHLFTYLAVVLSGRALASHRRYVDRALRAHVLETQLARAQLHFLELQLQPHFLFNSLHAIQELAHESAAAAERMLRRLQALLAMSLERSGRDEVSLADELAALEPYVDIQRTRFDWLAVRVEASDEARSALVPHLILQPLVENAIRHGLAVRQGSGEVEIVAERRGDRLRLRVRDNGAGLSPLPAEARSGIGLRNAGERLRQLYGSDHTFQLREARGGGVLVEIDIPFRPAADTPPRPTWTEGTRSRATIPEIQVDEMANWRTGEFVAAVANAGRATPAPAMTAVAEGPAPAPPEEEADPDAPPVLDAVAGRAEPESPLLTMRTWWSLVAVWFGAALFWTAQIHFYWYVTEPNEWMGWSRETSELQLAGAMYWLAVSLGVLWLSRRFRLGRRRLVAHLAVHMAAAVAVSFGFLWFLRALGLSTAPILDRFNINPLTGNFFVYFALLAWSHWRDFVAWVQSHELTSAQLTAMIARSRFRALCVQVRPQFLLGTLDLLARLVHVDVPRADRLIARLADVLRLTLDMAREQTTTLQQELQLLTACVEAHRLGVRPSVGLETEIDPNALAAAMPSRLLCTMVDDLLATDGAGEASAVPPLTVRVTAERGDAGTQIRVEGDSEWAPWSDDPHAWWRPRSAAAAAVADAGANVSVSFPDRTSVVLTIADEPAAAQLAPAAA